MMRAAASAQAPPPRSAECGDALGRDQRLGSEFQRRERHRPPAFEQHRQRFRIGPGIELGGGGDVALGPGAGHQYDLLDPVDERRFGGEREGKVRRRADADQRHPRLGTQQGADRVCRNSRGRGRTFGQRHTGEAVRTMHLRLGAEGAEQRALGAADDGYGTPGQADDAARVPQRMRQADIAPRHRDQPDVQRVAGQGQPKRHGIIRAWIGIDDADPAGHASSCSTSEHQKAAPCGRASSLKSKCGLWWTPSGCAGAPVPSHT
jgi:hypothetical protein